MYTHTHTLSFVFYGSSAMLFFLLWDRLSHGRAADVRTQKGPAGGLSVLQPPRAACARYRGLELGPPQEPPSVSGKALPIIRVVLSLQSTLQ